MLNFPVPRAVRPGAAKPSPFTVLVVANPVLEGPWKSGQFTVDPIMSDQPAFAACVDYVEKSLFGMLPNQVEKLLGEAAIAPKVRFLSLFKAGLAALGQFAFVAQDPHGGMLVPRRDAIRHFLQQEGILADVVYAVSGSEILQRASTWYTSDDDNQGGVPFLLDGMNFVHRFWYTTPGTIALPVNATELTAVHEFQHAISSYTNGMIVDQYLDSRPAVNVKREQPAPTVFGNYTSNAVAPLPAGELKSDLTRSPINYPSTWKSYHCERHDPARPAIMDNYWHAPVPLECQNDKVSREFVLDRVRARLQR